MTRQRVFTCRDVAHSGSCSVLLNYIANVSGTIFYYYFPVHNERYSYSDRVCCVCILTMRHTVTEKNSFEFTFS